MVQLNRVTTVLQVWSWYRLSHRLNGFLCFQDPWNCSSPLFSSGLNIKDTNSNSDYLYEISCFWVWQFSWKNILRAICSAHAHSIANLGGTGEPEVQPPRGSRHSLHCPSHRWSNRLFIIWSDKISHSKEKDEFLYLGLHNPSRFILIIVFQKQNT